MLRIHVTITLAGCFLVFLFIITSCEFLEEVRPRFTAENTGPYYLFEPYLDEVKTLLEEEDTHILQARENLISRIERNWLGQKPYSVVDNREFIQNQVPGIDPHDYVSLYSFVWPVEESPGEFVIRDGQRNPAVDNYDRLPLANMSKAVEDLSLAYYLTEDPQYAEKTAEFVKAWFLNEETRMNPNFNYTQITPGEEIKRGLQGIVEARDFIPVIEGVSLIYDSEYWTEENHLKLKQWFYDFLRWIIQNYNEDAFIDACDKINPVPECDRENGRIYGSNIATWLDAQKTIYALFTEQEDLLKSSQILPLSESVYNRIADNGRQPIEADRQTPQHYTYFNMKGLMMQAEMRTRAAVNPSDLVSKTGSGSYKSRLKAGLDWLIPFAEGTEHFRDSQDFYTCRYIEIYRPAALAMNDPKYERVVESIIRRDRYNCVDILTLLTHPPFES